ncbi:MAG TPA: FAD-dependent oxidoreductase [Gaiellaceae bacterium]|nr:FAD-dependent oxidoreductase [Gaiellaceae bacterium]
MASTHHIDAALTRELRPPLSPELALLEADRCLGCGGPYAKAPCTLACPAGIDVPGFVAALADGDVEEAAQTIFAENLLGGTCSRVCPVEVLCQGACVLQHEGREPIAIGSLQRYATDAVLTSDEPRLRERAPATNRSVAVIGAGPSGMVCAGELAALGHKVIVFDEHDEVGGLVRYAIAPYREQLDPLPAEAAALTALGVEFRLGTPSSAPDALEAIAGADAVFLGVGLGADTNVPYPGDDLPGVWNSLPFIEAIKTGTPPRIGREVVVIGGGNTAIDVACEAIRMGAELVTIVYRRTRAEIPAYAHEVAEAEAEGVRFLWLAEPVRFLGTHRLDAVECRLMSLGEPDESGRRRPAPVNGSEFTLPADTVIKAIGQRPRTELTDWIDGIEFDHGALKIDPETGQTSNPRFFAGGDVTNRGASVVEAVREGKLAARAIDRWLSCTS